MDRAWVGRTIGLAVLLYFVSTGWRNLEGLKDEMANHNLIFDTVKQGIL